MIDVLRIGRDEMVYYCITATDFKHFMEDKV